MSFDWREYLTLAEELAGRAKIAPAEEARLRSAVSRAYYAAFCKARNRLRDQERVEIPPFDVHKYVWGQFKRSGNSGRKQIGTLGDRLKKDRVRADYDDTVSGLTSLTWKAIRQSLLIIDHLSRL